MSIIPFSLISPKHERFVEACQYVCKKVRGDRQVRSVSPEITTYSTEKIIFSDDVAYSLGLDRSLWTWSDYAYNNTCRFVKPEHSSRFSNQTPRVTAAQRETEKLAAQIGFDIRSFKNGDQASFTSVFNAYQASLQFFAQKNGIRSDEACDIVTDKFVKLWEKRADFEDLYKIKAFLFISVKNACLNAVSKNGNEKRTLGNYHEHLSTNGMLTQGMPDDSDFTIKREKRLKQIFEVIDTLSPATQEVIKMSYLDEMSGPEIGQQLDKNVRTVQNLKQYGLSVLREKLLGNTGPA